MARETSEELALVYLAMACLWSEGLDWVSGGVSQSFVLSAFVL